MKLKIVQTTREVIETDYELPVYLYWQDELCNNTLVMIDENIKITISSDHFSSKIETSTITEVHDFNENDITTKDHFVKEMNEALTYLQNNLNKE